MNNLDLNALFEISKSMELQDILSLCQTSSQMKKLCDSRFLWAYLLERDYDLKPKFDMLFLENPEQVLYKILYNLAIPYKPGYSEIYKRQIIIFNKGNEEITLFIFPTYYKTMNAFSTRLKYVITTVNGEIYNAIRLSSTYLEICKLYGASDSEDPKIEIGSLYGDEHDIHQSVIYDNYSQYVIPLIKLLNKLSYYIVDIR